VFAGSDEVFPGALTPTGAGDDVVECQVAAVLATILAGFFIAEQDICSCRLEGDTRYSYVGKQLYDDGSFKLKATSLNALFDQLTDAVIDEGDFLLGKQHDETTLRDDRKRLERGIQYENGHMELPFLSVRADTNSRQRGRSVRCRKGKGSDLYPSASSAACDDDWLDKDCSVLHVQVYLARRDMYHLLSGSYSNLGRWGSD